MPTEISLVRLPNTFLFCIPPALWILTILKKDERKDCVHMEKKKKRDMNFGSHFSFSITNKLVLYLMNNICRPGRLCSCKVLYYNAVCHILPFYLRTPESKPQITKHNKPDYLV